MVMMSEAANRSQQSTEVSKNPLHRSQVSLPGIMHVETNLLGSVGDVGPSEHKVQKSTSQAAVLCGITGVPAVAVSFGLVSTGVV